MVIEQVALKAAIKSALDDMFDTKLSSLLDSKLEPLRSSMDCISNGFDEMKKKIAALENTNAELAKKSQFLRQENSRVSNALNQMKSAHDEEEQYIRRDCLDVRGVPTSSGKDTNEIVKKVGSIVDVCIKDKDISKAISIVWNGGIFNCCSGLKCRFKWYRYRMTFIEDLPCLQVVSELNNILPTWKIMVEYSFKARNMALTLCHMENPKKRRSPSFTLRRVLRKW